MAGSILENLSGRKLSVIVGIVLCVQVLSFLLGGLIAPSPTNADQILATVCAQEKPTVPGDFTYDWAIPRGKNGPKNCKIIENLQEAMEKDVNITSNHVIFAFQLPLPRDKMDLDYSRWQQNMMGVLHIEFVEDAEKRLHENPVFDMDIKMGYRNKHDDVHTWHMLGNSTETRTLECDLNVSHTHVEMNNYGYDCDAMAFFELGSLHHDFYLINIKMPLNQGMTINKNFNLINDVWLVVIHQNGGFTKVWMSMKCVFLPIIVATMIWYWGRIKKLERSQTFLEGSILAMGVAMTVINVPVELLTLFFEMPYMTLICDIRQGLFYAMLLSFWIIFCGEHLMENMDEATRGRMSAYWKQLSGVFAGCLSTLIFDMCERGAHLANPFHSIWASKIGKDLSISFLTLTTVCGAFYFFYLCFLCLRVRKNISAKRTALSAMNQTRRLFYQGMIYRFKFLLVTTIVTSGLTLLMLYISRWSEGQWKFNEDISIEYTSAFLTGVLGMWNCYVFMLLVLYAPSHKRKNQDNDLNVLTDENLDSIEFSRLTHTDSCAEVPEASGVASLSEIARKVNLD